MIRVAFRVDSGRCHGSGHLTRCLTLASELRREGASVRFVCAEHAGSQHDLVALAGFQIDLLAVETGYAGEATDPYSAWRGGSEAFDAHATADALRGDAVQWLVVDHYGLGRRWEAEMRSIAERILCIDDLARSHDADAILDQNWFGASTPLRYRGKVSATARSMLGPQFALLQPEYAEARGRVRTPVESVRRAVAYFGAADPHDCTSDVIAALSTPDLDRVELEVIVGASHPEQERVRELAAIRPQTRVLEQRASLADILAEADLAFGAGGATTWERACLGVPSLVTILSDNQRLPALALNEDGVHVVVGEGKPTVDQWRKATCALAGDVGRRLEMAARGRRMTDGLGARRVARALLGRSNDFSVRAARLDDEELTLRWANDPAARAMSFTQEPIGAGTHAAWFRRFLADPDTLYLIGEDETGLPAGQVRFSRSAGAAEAVLSISVDPLLRGLGLGSTLLRLALQEWAGRFPGVAVVAEVREENPQSATLFLNAGFSELASRRPGARLFCISNGLARKLPSSRGTPA